MSDFRAIAGVSRTLKKLLLDRMSETPEVTIAPPDVKVIGVNGKWLNIYLYHMTENGYLKNQEIPGHGHPGSYGHPPLSLDLHYLLTAYATDETTETADLETQQMMGDAMRVLNDFSIVTDSLEITKTAAGTVGDPILDTTLLNEFERVKITLQPVSMEELSKIWTALHGANFRRSSAYQVSVVQIESTRLKRIALPVKTRHIHVSTLKRPEITDVYRTPSTGEPSGDTRAAIGQELTIEGNNFIAPRTWVRLGGLEPIGISSLSNNKINITIPDNQYPIDPDHPVPRDISENDRLQPGPHVVEVIIRRDTEVVQGGLDKGTVVTDQIKQGSNFSVFMLVPEVANINPANGTSAVTLLTVNGKRLYHEDGKNFVLIGDIAIEVRKPSTGDPWAAPSETSIQVPLEKFIAATSSLAPRVYDFLVRVMVNGAQSMDEKIYKYTKT